MSIYRKNALFLVPKAENYRPTELPKRDFLLQTRIVDRRGKPDYTANDLGIKITNKLKIKRPPQNLKTIPLKTGNMDMMRSCNKLMYGLTNDQIVTLLNLKSHFFDKNNIESFPQFAIRGEVICYHHFL